jgi:hypothetical protein
MVARSISNFPTFPRFLRRDASIASIGSTESANASSKTKASKQTRQRRRSVVTFALDENDAIKTVVHEYEKPTEEEKPLCYTTKAQVKAQKKQVAIEAIEFARANAKFIERLDAMFNSPLTPGSMRATMDEKEVIETIFKIGDSEARGYEGRMCPLMLRHRQWAMKSIIRRQDQLKKDGVCPPSISELLRACCETVNGSARGMAIKYAMADGLEAQKVYDDVN